MMRGLIKPDHYRNPQHLQWERTHLFHRCWIFAGMLFELQGQRHRSVRIGDTELIIQCDKAGKPQAYRNVCSHRHAQLCEPGLHTGPVRCPYHGWVYDREGVPVGIPQQQAFPEVVARPADYRLQAFSCETAGAFIFVRLSSEGPTLQEYLGQEFDFLCRASAGMTGIADEFQRDVQANWKVLIENSLEGYHVPAVHNKTFMKVEGMQRGHEAPVDFLEHPLHTYMQHPAEEGWLRSFERRVEPKLGRWAWRFPHYTHHLIFPNLTVTSFMGYSYHVQSFAPSAADATSVHSRTISAEFEGQSPVGTRLMEQIHADSKEFTDRVFQEDSSICSAVQRGLNNAVQPAIIGAGIEARVAHFHKAYHRQLSSMEQASL